MQGTYDTVEKLKGEYGDKVTFMVIGQAGEMMLGGASIQACDRELHPTRAMGRGGVGAVMGSKKIKAFILDETGTRTRQPADEARFKAAATIFNDGLRRHGVSGQGLPSFGTNVLTNILNEAGGYPTSNFQHRPLRGCTKITGETQAATMTERGGEPTHACHRGCIIQCSGIYNDATGKYESKQAEYETVWSHGGNCGISDLDIIQKLDRMDDDFGLDTIETGVAIGVAMEGGLLPFGDGEGAIRVLAEVGKGITARSDHRLGCRHRPARHSASYACRSSRTRRCPPTIRGPSRAWASPTPPPRWAPTTPPGTPSPRTS